MLEFLQPEGWAKPIGYANGVAATGRTIFVGGQIGWNGQCQFETDDFVGQVRQTLENIVAVLKAGGAEPQHITSMTWYFVDKQEYTQNLRGLSRHHRPALPGHGRRAGGGADRRPRQDRDTGHRRRAGVSPWRASRSPWRAKSETACSS